MILNGVMVKLWPRCGDFSISQDGGRRHLGFQILEILTVGTHNMAKLRQPRPRYGDFSIFQDGGHALPSWIFKFCKF